MPGSWLGLALLTLLASAQSLLPRQITYRNIDLTLATGALQLWGPLPETLPSVSAGKPSRGLKLTQPMPLDSAQVLLQRPSGSCMAC